MTTTTPTERAALILQMDAEYVTVAPDPARTCSNCRWYSELPGTAQCHLVVDSPEPINGGAWCNRHEPMPEGSAVITYMEDYGVDNPNNANIPAGILADSIANSGEALENLNQYAADQAGGPPDDETRSGFAQGGFVHAAGIPMLAHDTAMPRGSAFFPNVISGSSTNVTITIPASDPLAADTFSVVTHTVVDDAQDTVTRSALPAMGQGVVAYRFVNRAASVDTLEGVVRGYVYIYGDPEHRDAYNTWFDPARPVELDIENGAFRRPIKYEHCQDSIIGMDTIGYIESVQPDAVGLRFEGRLDRSSPHYERIVGELQRGELFTSSATGEHTAKFRDDGSFESWTLLELSLTRYPAESRMPGVTLIRSASQEEVHAEPRAGDEPHVEIEISLPEAPDPEGEKTMTPEQLAMLQQLVAEFGVEAVTAALQQQEQAPAAEPVAEAMSAAPAPDARSLFANLRAALEANKKNADVEALRSRIAALEAERSAAPAQQPITRGASRPGEGVNVNWIPDSKTRNLSAPDMWFVQQALGANGKGVSEAFTRAMAAKSVDHFQQPARQGDEFAQGFVRSFGNKRADEIMATNIAGQGTEWVGVAYATDLWEKIRVAPVYDTFRSLGMMEMSLGQGQNSIYVPTEGADPTWYSAPEANDLSSGRIEVTSNPQFVGTGRVQVTPGTLKATVAWSEELDEDSLIPMASWLNTQMARSAAEVAEYALINGDTVTTANTNLNLIDDTPGTGASRPRYLATNGILKLPIITTTSLSYDANNTHTEETYLEVLKKLPNEVNGDVNNVVFIIGVREHFAAINIPAFKTRDVNSQATIEDGVLSRIYGRKVLMSGQIALANTAGKISATAGNNLYGRIIAAVPRYWAVVNKRDVRFKLSEDPYNDAQLLRVSFRMGATYRSTTSAAAAAYEVAV